MLVTIPGWPEASWVKWVASPCADVHVQVVEVFCTKVSRRPPVDGTPEVKAKSWPPSRKTVPEVPLPTNCRSVTELQFIPKLALPIEAVSGLGWFPRDGETFWNE